MVLTSMEAPKLPVVVSLAAAVLPILWAVYRRRVSRQGRRRVSRQGRRGDEPGDNCPMLEALPPEVLCIIASRLGSSTLLRFGQCSRACKAIADDEELWLALLCQIGFSVNPSATVVTQKELFRRAVGARKANDKFYASFTAGDIEAMRRLWLADDGDMTAHLCVPHESELPRSWVPREASDWPSEDLRCAARFCIKLALSPGYSSHPRRPLPVWGRSFCRHPGDSFGGFHGFDNVIESWAGLLQRGGLVGLDIRPRCMHWEITSCGRVARVVLEEVIHSFPTRNPRVLKDMHNAFVLRSPTPGAVASEWRMVLHDSPCPLYEQLPGGQRMWMSLSGLTMCDMASTSADGDEWRSLAGM